MTDDGGAVPERRLLLLDALAELVSQRQLREFPLKGAGGDPRLLPVS